VRARLFAVPSGKIANGIPLSMSCHAVSCTVPFPSGCQYEIHWLFERLFPAALLYRLMECLMTPPVQARHQLFPAVFTVSRFGVMNQQNSHDLLAT
jgi:hypothetical protein